jgi:hypothetical protein
MKKLTLFMVVVIISLTVGGCAKRAAFMYNPSEKVPGEVKNAPLPLKVSVTPFLDARGQNNTSYLPLDLIPLVPYASLHYDRPDASNRFIYHAAYNFRPSEDFARAVVDEMKQNHFFEEVFLTQREREPGVDLTVTGKIISTRYNAKVLSYGLSVYGRLLPLLGLPIGTTQNSISLILEMKRASDGVVVWSYEVNGEWGKTVGIYYNWAADFDGYPLILREGLHAGMEKLADDLRTKELDYWKGKSWL